MKLRISNYYFTVKLNEKIKRDRNLPFEDGEIHLKNLNFKEHIKRIAYLSEFKDEILKLLRCKLGCKTPKKLKKHIVEVKIDLWLLF